ncbi:NADH dehydrogenase [ubiquinone] 1 alpha subcomplex subunit 9, mitochondrial [Hypsizygus marmoreus]|uniref:NADH dehydrogenase [ubiquinone] 1 alpha subcomplex subunit 9, mitochondrial n=1 Tax=Hypsizygus marmoreus TaxID=39966 RepID=A0A369K5D3_HYPMA|nr:NADH dehydrogenase [ubiquinone] 1 alpha subcomplex subunit 9, mitochondrial [Hypsizygus marmoreus]
MPHKVVICGAGFLGSNIARAVAASSCLHQVQLSSRHPERLHAILKNTIPKDRLLPPVPLDVTKPSSLSSAFEGAAVIVSLVGVMHGSPKDFEDIQWKGAENVAKAARSAGAKLIHFSAIGADANSNIPYVRTKGLAEASVRSICSDATIFRPSIVFGPDDDFFNRFSRLSKFLPFLPVFGGGKSRFQPVYVGDISRAVEIITRNDPEIDKLVSGKIVEAGGPEIFTYRELMELVLEYNQRYRPIISVPYQVGMIQGAILERLPVNLFTVTRAQVEQLKFDNVVNPSPSNDYFSFRQLLEKYSGPLTSVHDILPRYLR